MASKMRVVWFIKGSALASALMLVLAACIPGAVIGGVVCLVGCEAVIAHIDEEYGNGPEHAIVPSSAHPIFVDSEVTTLAIRGGGLSDEGGEFDAAALGELDGFLDDFIAQGSGSLDVTVALGEGGQSRLVRETEAIAKYALARGVSRSMLNIRAVSGGEEGEAIALNYERINVRLPECGDWSKPSPYNPRNTQYSNFGCADQRNLGLLVANPADLAGAATYERRDATRTALVIRAYRAGDATQSEYDLPVTGTLSVR
jgi:pilus assembly protein CpaD